MTIKELITKFGFKIDAKALKKFDDDVKKTQNRLNEVGKNTASLGKKLTLGLTTPIALAAGGLIHAGSEAEETRERFEALFEKVGPLAQKTAAALASSFGMAESSTQALLSSTGDLLIGLDFTQKTALQVGNQIVKLSADLASYKNVEGGAAAVAQTLNKALLGQNEILRKNLGIVISDKDVEKEMLKIRMAGVQGTEEQIKALATLRLIQQKSVRAQGSFNRQVGGFASQWAIFKDTVKETAAAFGDLLLPIATFFIRRVLIPMLKFFRDLPKPIKGVILAIGAIAAAIGPTLLAFAGLMKFVVVFAKPLMGILALLKAINWAAVGMAGLWIAAFAGLFLLLEDILAFAQGRKSVIKLVFEKLAEGLDWLGEKFKGFGMIVKIALATALTPVRAFFQAIQGLGGIVGALSQGDFGGALGAAKGALKNIVMPDVNDFGALIGFGQEARNQVRPTPQMTAGGGAGSSVSVQNTITVPEGTPPQLVGDSIEKGIQKSMAADLRRTRDVVQPSVAY